MSSSEDRGKLCLCCRKFLSNGVENATLGWVLETVSAFLKSPDYVVPVMNFIDEKCMCFDDAEENHLELTSIHQEFIALVFR
jgi:hypothetical protein